MLEKRWQRWIVIASLFLAADLAFASLSPCPINPHPAHQVKAQKEEKSAAESCGFYQAVSVRALLDTVDFIEGHEKFVMAAATIVIAIFTAVLALVTDKQIRLTRETIELSNKEFIASNPPILRVSNIIIDAPIPGMPGQIVKNGHPVTGSYTITNIGGSDAKIFKHTCVVFWARGTLPMKKPYTVEKISPTLIIEPGAYLDLHIKSVDLMDDTDGSILGGGDTRLYIMGTITYKDGNGKNRRTHFCRVYKAGERRFVKIEDNEDYESEQ